MTDELIVQRLIDRANVRRQVESCTRCGLYERCSGPVAFGGPTPSSVVIVGEAPGAEEDRVGVPFVGKSGRLLRDALTEVGIEYERITFINTVSCYPGRTPKSDEIVACRDNFYAQLGLAMPEYVLLLGNTALFHFRPGERIGECRGQWWKSGPLKGIIEEAWIFATYHPAAILRNGELRDTFIEDLQAFKFFSLGVFDPWDAQICTAKDCKAYAVQFYNGKGKCREHMEDKKEKAGEAGRRKGRREENAGNRLFEP